MNTKRVCFFAYSYRHKLQTCGSRRFDILYHSGDSAYEQIDKETLQRLKDIQKLSKESKEHVFALLDAFIMQAKLQAIL
ncbi:hypothetical protein [Maribacter sp. 2304DJ31-5]|uniref:hypothetical protein n=1 Tax=Maribacter sp. 2304DJ31-5 TaxID=3386273 RepID=UPI0039BD71EF